MSLTLSNRQFPLLMRFSDKGAHISIREAQGIDQRPFRSFLVRGYVEYSATKKAFVLTPKGREAWGEFHGTSIDRTAAQALRPLTRYFDPVTYQIGPAPKRKGPKRATRDNVREFIAGKSA